MSRNMYLDKSEIKGQGNPMTLKECTSVTNLYFLLFNIPSIPMFDGCLQNYELYLEIKFRIVPAEFT